MFHNYTLKSAVWHEAPLSFEWDSGTGEVRGTDAERVKRLVAMAVSDGGVESHPFPTRYDIEDPLHRPAEMAAILGMFWELPADLAKHLPAEEVNAQHEADDTSLS